MQVVSISHQHEPQLSLLLVPETEVERTLLLSMWKHGRLELCNGVVDNSCQGYAITVEKKSEVEEPVDRLRTNANKLQGECIELESEIQRLQDSEELAWGIIANAWGGNWSMAGDEWRGAAERWRDEYHKHLPEAPFDVEKPVDE